MRSCWNSSAWSSPKSCSMANSKRSEVKMSHRLFVLLGALAALIALAVPATAQQAPSKTWTPPKTPWGDPDIQGIWPGNTGVPMQRAANIGERTTLTDQEFAQKEAQAKRQAEADNQSVATSDTRAGIGPP